MDDVPLAVAARDVSRAFGAVNALKKVNLSVRQGEIYGFLGPNGSGKSTLVRIMSTLLLPTAGSVAIMGLDVVKRPSQVKLAIGVALQELSLDAKQTGYELMTLQCRLYGLSAAARRRRIAELEDLVDIGDAMKRQIRTYSGGMKRRLDLALSLIHQPKALFLDEPTTGLDPLSRKRIWEQIIDVNKKHGTTIFLTTQYLDEADAIADRIGIINEGTLVTEGSPDELKAAVGKDVIFLRVGGDPDAAFKTAQAIKGVERVQKLGDQLALSVDNGSAVLGAAALKMTEQGHPIEEIALRKPTLDDVFLQFTGKRIETDLTAADNQSETSAADA